MKSIHASAMRALAMASLIMLAACGKPTNPTVETEATPPVSTRPPAVEAPPAAQQTGAPRNANATDLKDPVATVDGEPITRAQLDDALNEAVSAAGMKADALSAEQKMEGYRQILDDLIMDRLLSKAASGIIISKEEVEAEIEKIKSQFSSEDEFQQQLAAVGQTPEKLAETLSKILRQRQWVESQIKDVAAVTEEDAKKFYDENREQFEEAEQVKASHILFMVKNAAPEEEVKTALDKARQAATRAKKEDFKKLAIELSEEPGAKESGGDLGYFTADRMVPEFSAAAFALQPGEVSEPIRTQFGWHVIKVEDRKPAGVSPFEEVKEQLESYLQADKQRKAVQDLLQSLRDKATIENTLPQPKEEN